MLTDPIADMLTRIRNAVRVERGFVDMPTSKSKRMVAEVLKREGYIWDYSETDDKPVATLRLELKYGPNGERVVQRIRRISRPGRRVYAGAGDLRPVLGGMGIYVVSTSAGMLSDREARSKGVGGEVICEIY
ncbi:MAG TPA: 30S ribosomal protein S8 [Pirellulaceae bacterium]|jgi:small subunit ribosomal protein S8|nr:30S ribosomal protein S8 [Pirellulaceae bacterium]